MTTFAAAIVMAACAPESAPTELVPTQAPLPTATDAAHPYRSADCLAANGHARPVTHACAADTNCDCDRDPRAYSVTHCHAGADANPWAGA